MKKCKGTGKAKNFGCGVELPFTEKNGIKTYKATYGLGIDCGCFYKFDKLNKKKPIPKRSKKRIAQEFVYSKLRKAFLNKPENKFCAVYPKLLATTIHHKKGRIGDLLNDTRFWVALSMEGHKFVENNPIWAKENGFSLSRLENND